MAGSNRVGKKQSGRGDLLKQTTRQRADMFDPNKLRGHDLLRVLAFQGTADVRKVVGKTVGLAPVKIFEGGTFPQVVTFRTGMTRIIAGPPLMIRKFGRGQEPKTGSLKPLNSIPLDTSYADEHTIIVRPGEVWWARFVPPGVAPDPQTVILTVIWKSILVLE